MRKIAFLFPGQGVQYIGMGKELYDNIPESREIFEIADKELGFSISKLCFSGCEEELNKTQNTQLAVLTTSIASLRALEKEGIKSDIAAGLSLGEYSALVCSGALEFNDCVNLVKKRGMFMEEAVPSGLGTMVSIIGLEVQTIQEICKEASKKGIVEIANLNCPGQVVISGEITAVDYACTIAEDRGALRTIYLSVSGPFHTSMLKSASDKLYEELKNISIHRLNIPVMTNVTGENMDACDIKDNLKQQIMSTVYWEKTIRNMIAEGVDTFIEVGPGKVLSGFVKKINKKLNIFNVEDLKSLRKTVDALMELEVMK